MTDPPPSPPDLTPLLSGIGMALTGGQIAFIHTRPEVRRRIRAGDFVLWNAVIALLRDMGYRVALMPFYRPPWLRWLNRRCLHIYRGPGRPWRGPGVLHIARGYVDGYYYVDPMGQREWSSIAGRTYRGREIPADLAGDLFRRLRRRIVNSGRSHRDQAPRGAWAVPEGAIAIMLQGLKRGDAPQTALCSEAEMVRAVVAARGARPVVIKYHPFGATRSVRQAVEAVLDPAGGVQLTEANVHDVVDAAAMIVTQTSSVGFEAMLHRTPSVLFARADYHHGAVLVETMEDVGRALDAAANHDLLYARYVYWFLEKNLLRPDAIDFRARLKRIVLEAAGLEKLS